MFVAGKTICTLGPTDPGTLKVPRRVRYLDRVGYVAFLYFNSTTVTQNLVDY